MNPDHPLLVALAHAMLAHCPHRLGHSERYVRDPDAAWRIIREPCAACAALAEALGLESAGFSRAG